MTVSLERRNGRLHRTHSAERMPIMGEIYGCVNCWRIVALKSRDVTFAGRCACRPNPDIVALAEHYWEQVRGQGAAGVERAVSEFRAALRGRGNDMAGVGEQGGGRHAARG